MAPLRPRGGGLCADGKCIRFLLCKFNGRYHDPLLYFSLHSPITRDISIFLYVYESFVILCCELYVDTLTTLHPVGCSYLSLF